MLSPATRQAAAQKSSRFCFLLIFFSHTTRTEHESSINCTLLTGSSICYWREHSYSVHPEDFSMFLPWLLNFLVRFCYTRTAGRNDLFVRTRAAVVENRGVCFQARTLPPHTKYHMHRGKTPQRVEGRVVNSC